MGMCEEFRSMYKTGAKMDISVLSKDEDIDCLLLLCFVFFRLSITERSKSETWKPLIFISSYLIVLGISLGSKSLRVRLLHYASTSKSLRVRFLHYASIPCSCDRSIQYGTMCHFS